MKTLFITSDYLPTVSGIGRACYNFWKYLPAEKAVVFQTGYVPDLNLISGQRTRGRAKAIFRPGTLKNESIYNSIVYDVKK